jgi:hypothetical protein
MVGCKQWQFTDINLFDINRLVWNEETKWGVIINHELVVQLMLLGVKASNITFYSDCKFRSDLVNKKLDGITVIDLPNDEKEFKRFVKNMKTSPPEINYVLNNVPFGKFKEFKELAETVASDKALIISGSRDYHNKEVAFKNVELYKYLGRCFPTAKITASLAIVNPAGAKNFKVVDSNGNECVINRSAPIPPGNNTVDYTWAMNIVSMNLPGYDKFETGNLYRKDAIFDKDGLSIAFTMGRANSEFDKDNYGNSYDNIQRQSTAWSKVSKSQQHLLGGYGEHSIGVSYMANENGHLGNVKYMSPDIGCGAKTYCHPVKDKADAKAAIKYFNHPDVIKLVSVLKSAVTSNSKATFELIPHHSQASNWIKNYV